MKQRLRRNSKPPAADVIDLLEDSDEAAAADAPAQPSTRRAGRGRAAAAAAAAAIAAGAGESGPAQAGYDGDYEFVDSDFEPETDEQPVVPSQQQQKAVSQGRKRALPLAGAAAAAANGSGPKAPAAKRAKTAAGGGRAGSKGGTKGGGKGAKALSGKQATAKVTDSQDFQASSLLLAMGSVLSTEFGGPSLMMLVREHSAPSCTLESCQVLTDTVLCDSKENRSSDFALCTPNLHLAAQPLYYDRGLCDIYESVLLLWWCCVFAAAGFWCLVLMCLPAHRWQPGLSRCTGGVATRR